MTTDDEFAARVRRLLTMQADQLTQDAPGLSGPLLRAQAEQTGHRAQRFVTPVLAAAAVLALFLLPLLISRDDRPGPGVHPAGPGSSVVMPAPRQSPTVRRSATPISTPTPAPRSAVPSASPKVVTPSATFPPLTVPFMTSEPAPSATS